MIPHAVEAEAAVVGAMLLRPEATPEAAAVLQPEDFGAPLHAAVFGACVDLWKVGIRPDPVTVAARLESGGVAFNPADLISLQANAVSFHPANYARIVAEHATRRRCIGMAGELARVVADPTIDLEDTLERARADLDLMRLPNAVQVSDVVEAETFAYTPDSPLAWIVPGMIDVEDRVIVVAPEGVGKSMVSRWIAASTSQGMHPFAQVTFAPQRTLIVDLENPGRTLRRTLRGMLDPLRSWAGPAYDPSTFHVWHRPAGINLRTRSGAAELDAVIARTQPRLVCLGPIYKCYRGDPRRSEHDNASDVAAVLDDLRTRHGFALMLEHHAPLAQGGGTRELRPFGSLLWSQWPEVGVTLAPTDDTRRTLKVGFYRGLRDERAWPITLTRSHPWPWRATYPEEQM